jgi:exopolysaccharide production protein ExoQ
VIVLHAELSKRQANGRSARATALVLVCGLAPLAFWLAGTHQPVSDFARLPTVTFGERIVGRAGQLALAVLIISAVLQALSRREKVNLSGRRLWLSYMAFSAGPVLAMAGGTHPGFQYAFLFAPAAATTVFFFAQREPQKLLILFRRLLLTYVWGSLVLELLNHAWAFDTQARGTLLLGTRPRLFGVTVHPNALGPAAAMALLLVLATSRGRWRWANAFAAGLVLIQTDSRMAIAGTAAALLVLFTNRRERGRHLRIATVAIAVALPLAAILGTGSSPQRWIATATDGGVSGAQLSTLNGRAAVWQTTLSEWRRNRAFGYGPSLWSPEYRRQFGQRFNWVGQAHNQWVQSLGDSGLVGLAGLALYVTALIRAATRTSNRSRGLTLALVVMLLFRMMSESALRNTGLDLTLFLHLATFATLIAYTRQEEGSTSPALAAQNLASRPSHGSSLVAVSLSKDNRRVSAS